MAALDTAGFKAYIQCMICYSPLPSRHFIQVTGADAKAFLQGLLTVDVLKLNSNEIRYGLLLAPQGKYLHDMFIIGQDDGLLIDVEAVQAEALLKRLKLYKLKRDVQLKMLSEWHAGALFGAADTLIPPLEHILILPDPRLITLGQRVYSATPIAVEVFNSRMVDVALYVKHRILLGVPEGVDMIPDKSFSFDFDMDDLHAIDYTKGCYVGQEVTARMHYRGVPKKGIYQITSADGSALPTTGTEITCDGHIAGALASVADNHAIAMLRHEMITGGALLAGSCPVFAARPSWAKPMTHSNEESL